jgi:hypothetical protein
METLDSIKYTLQTRLILKKNEVIARDDYITSDRKPFGLSTHLADMHNQCEKFVDSSAIYNSLRETVPVATAIAKCNKRDATFRRQLNNITDWEAVLGALRK